MWDLIVSFTDHCLSFDFTWNGGVNSGRVANKVW